jgi:hypothetical protein
MKKYLSAIIIILLSINLNAQFIQQGNKLVGTGAAGNAEQGYSVSISSDGNTAIVGGWDDNNYQGAVWIYTRQNGVWSQQGDKLVGTGATGIPVYRGFSVSISSDGNTAIVGGYGDNYYHGAAWIYTRQNGVWSQQGPKLVGSGAVGYSQQGRSVSISSDGNTAIVGGAGDNFYQGAAWIYTRQNGVWTQQGPKLVGTGAVGNTEQGNSVSISSDGNTAIVGGIGDNNYQGAVWIYKRQNGVWSQQGDKLVGTGAVGNAWQGFSVSISSDGNTAIVGGIGDSITGASWIFTRQNGVWSQQGDKLVGTGVVGCSQQGCSVSISSDGNTAIVGGTQDNNFQGASWIFARQNGVWTQLGNKLFGTGAVGNSHQGLSVSISSDGNTAIIGGPWDNNEQGAAWIFTLNVNPDFPVPTLAYPTGGILVYTNSPVLNWYINKYFPGAKYNLQLSETPDFKSIYFEKDNIDGLQLEVTGLKGGKTYYSRVRLKAPDGYYSKYSEVGNFKVNSQGGTEPVKPVLAYPTGGATVYESSPTLNWYINQWAPPLEYHLQLSLTDDFINPILDVTGIEGLSYKVQGLSAGVTYYTRVRSFNSEGSYSEYSSTGTFTVNKDNGTQAITPVLAYPAGGVTVYTASPVLNWYIGGYSPLQKYNLQVSTRADFTTMVLNQDDISSLQYQLTGLSNGVTYFTRVRGKATDGTYSLFSSVGSFTVWAGDYPVVPVAASPSGGVNIHSGSATLSWYSPTGTTAEQKYDLQLSTDESFTEYNQVSGIDTISYNFSDLKGGTKYFWRVRSMTSDGKTSPYSSEGTFITSKVTNVALRSDSQIPKDFDLKQNYPNPFNPVTTIEFSLPKDEHVRLVVYDMLGRVAKELINETLNAGSFKASFKAEDLSSGVYIYKLSTPTFQKIRKMILQK